MLAAKRCVIVTCRHTKNKFKNQISLCEQVSVHYFNNRLDINTYNAPSLEIRNRTNVILCKAKVVSLLIIFV